MAIDWQADLEKKVANLVRKFDAEVKAHGDEVEVIVSVSVIPSHNKTDNAGIVPTTKKKK